MEYLQNQYGNKENQKGNYYNGYQNQYQSSVQNTYNNKDSDFKNQQRNKYSNKQSYENKSFSESTNNHNSKSFQPNSIFLIKIMLINMILIKLKCFYIEQKFIFAQDIRI